MKFICFIIISAVLLFLHEMGHYISAKLMNLTVDKVSASLLPLPRFYVSIIDKGISFTKRIIYYLSGNLITVMIFVFSNLVEFEGVGLIRLVIAVQIIIETNPFLSDYSTISFWLANKKSINKLPQDIYNSKQEKDIALYIENLREKFFLSPVWILHFTLWTLFIIYMLKKFL